MIPGQAPVPEKLVPKRQQGVKISENPSLATSPREVDTEMDKKIRSIVSSILKNASVPDADKDVPTSSTPNAEVLSSSSKEESTEEEDQATEETPAPRAPEPAPGDLIDLEEVESDEEPIANKLAPGIAERLQSRKGKTPITRSGRIKTMAQKKSTPITPTTSRWSKVAIPSKKRKEISSSDSDDDVELDVPDIKRAKKSGKKVPGNVPDAPLDNISFHSIGNVERWKFVYQRRLALERELGRDALDCKEIMDLIKAAGLLKTVTKLGDCYESLVREFIVNIPSDITNRKSDEYQKVFVRGKCIRFSPAVINKYLGRPTEGVVDIAVSEHQIAKEITAKQVQHWPKKGKLSAGKLSVKYAILHRIGTANWVPTNHTSTVATGLGKFLYAVGTKSKFNFGNYIFDQTIKHSESFAVKLPIAFPTVLCGIMLSQHPNILNNIDSVKKRESPLSLHYKLFEGTHVPDIVSTSGKAAASGAVSKDDLIAELKDTCKVLEATIKANTEKKMELERLIKRLSDNGKSGRKVPENVPDAPLDNISFHSIGNVEKWKYVYQRRLAVERELGRNALDCKETMELIKAAGLLKTVTKLGDCYEGLVREFIVNIPSDITNRKSDEYQKVFVRGKCVRFSPAVINKYLGRPTEGVVDIDVSEHQIAKEITAKQVQHWPKKGKLSAGKLSVKYAILHRIGAANWVPTNHTSTVATESFAVKLPIAFPTVLCGIMLSQHPNILNNIDSVMKRESPLSLHYKLFEGTHVPDIVSTSGKAAASGAVSKDALIAELKDTCKVLEATIKATTEKKMELERLIERLTDRTN
ncbi:hypothetical protein GmHk_20G057140 [Glycine max]|nr:hypothetical protein GmHk_20G057140 [Glycine max]